MKKNKNNTSSNTSTSSSDARDSYLKGWELALADLEKVGALFASVGYLTFFFAANLDTLTILDINRKSWCIICLCWILNLFLCCKFRYTYYIRYK